MHLEYFINTVVHVSDALAIRTSEKVRTWHFFMKKGVNGSVFGPCFVIQYFVSVYYGNHLYGEERAGSFALTASWCIVTVNVLWLFLTVPWVCLRFVFVVFSDHILFLWQLSECLTAEVATIIGQLS